MVSLKLAGHTSFPKHLACRALCDVLKTMSAAPADTAPTFAEAARRVHVWVTLRRWLGVLRMTFIPATLVMVLLMLSLLRGSALLVTPWIGLLLWLAGSLAYAWWRRPGEYNALALWDQSAGRREAFASAWWFEQRQEGGDFARSHVAAQRASLPDALPMLRRDLPLRPDRWLALPLGVAILGSFVSIVTAPRSDEVLMDAAMSRTAAEEARKLSQTDWEKKKLAGLEEDEKKQVEDLKQKLQKTAEDLANANGKDARSVLADLERRARDAEKLADELGKGREAWASEKLTEALRQHADTADLGDAVAAKNAKAAAKAAEQLAGQLKSPQLPADAKQRVTETLQDAEKQAEAEDRKRTVGQNVLAAGDQLRQGNAPSAGAEFQKLADKLKELELREQARKELQDLAQQLRESGNSIAGQNADGAMQQMSQAGPNSQQGSTPTSGQSPEAQQTLNPPGIGQQGQQNQMAQPQQQPGQGGQGQQQQQMMVGQGQSQQGQPGQQGQPSNGQPMLLAPVPGAPKPGSDAPVVLMQGNAPPDQPQGPLLSIPLAGGLQPGAGKAELNNTPTPEQDSSSESMVQAQQNSEGQSTVRSVEGDPRRAEQAARTATQSALDAIQAEEAALDEAALPPARREQVRRYFNELRKRFEKQ